MTQEKKYLLKYCNNCKDLKCSNRNNEHYACSKIIKIEKPKKLKELKKSQKNNIFCGNCKYYQPYCSNDRCAPGWGDYCFHDEATIIKQKVYGAKKIYNKKLTILSYKEYNKNNNCPYWEKCLPTWFIPFLVYFVIVPIAAFLILFICYTLFQYIPAAQ